MKVVDFIIITYYILFRRAKQNQIEVCVFLASVIPILFVFMSLLFVGSYALNIAIDISLFFVLTLVCGLAVNKYLLKYYSTKKAYLNAVCDRYQRLRLFAPIFLIGYFALSLLLFFNTLRLTPIF